MSELVSRLMAPDGEAIATRCTSREAWRVEVGGFKLREEALGVSPPPLELLCCRGAMGGTMPLNELGLGLSRLTALWSATTLAGLPGIGTG